MGGARGSVGFCYFMEFTPAKYKDKIGSLRGVFEGMTLVWITLYYMFIGKNWKVPVTIGSCLAGISFIMVWAFVPESPKWLYGKGRFEEC